ncbi:metallophosphoesterase family protein [Chryseobacterium gambrini]|uniref:Calcineurin-like phosphoesterase n=1 Tax=Chryseobacterium gambrini TaxID=373672 RepID=A0A1N7QMD7_9FLAO|nr:metallophosphoesterase [Chryseobacterium gambrini]SIT24060.1 Calcineurin-like phosphoesterase [Chryseobacterium gambrini]
MEALFYILLLAALVCLIFYFTDFKSAKTVKIFRQQNTDKYIYYFKPQKPVKWFNFTGLTNTFRMVSLSADILSVIDKREVQSGMEKDAGDELIRNNIHENKDEFWFDFIADTGDGFDSTTTVLYHLTRDSYTYSFKNEKDREKYDEHEITLKKGSALVIGGDLVYPVGSEGHYRDRFKGPLRFVAPGIRTPEKPSPILVATPGNHDWYDGLSAFFRLMCQKSSIGNYRTVQNRSYFAYALRKNVHLFGIDNQLLGDIDIPQMSFFKKYVENISGEGGKNHIILLIAEPYWYSYDIDDRHQRKQRMDSLEYITRALVEEVKKNQNNKEGETENKNKAELIFEIVITGDIHHYSNYKLDSDTKDYYYQVKHFITSGGGGAFGHVTDFLKEKIVIPQLQSARTNPLEYTLGEVYPSKEKSGKKIWWNFIFSIVNYEFTALLLMLSFVSTYVFCCTDSIMKELISLLLPLVLVFIISKVTNNECSDKEKWVNRILRFGLFVVSFAIQIFILYQFPHYQENQIRFLSDENLHFLGIDSVKTFLKIPVKNNYFLFQWIVSGILQSVLFGWYILFGYKVFKLYVTEISSGKVEEGKKNFLKFKITDTEIVIYVVAIKKAYKWMDLIKKKEASKVQREMASAKDPKRFLRDNFKSDPDNNVRIIDKITIKL